MNKKVVIILLILCFQIQLSIQDQIATRSFTYSEFLQCTEQNVLQCDNKSEKKEQCENELKIYTDKLDSEGKIEGNICFQCQEEQEKLRATTEKKDDSFLFPDSCTQCYEIIFKKSESEKISSIVEKYYLATKMECATNGKSAQKTLTKKSNYESCKAKCKECDSADQEFKDACDAQQLKVSTCEGNSDNIQCKFAQTSYSSAGLNDFVPFSYVVCEQLCRSDSQDDKAQMYKEIQACQEICLFAEDPAVEIKTMGFSYTEFEKCKNNNVLQCPKKFQNEDCEKWVKEFTDKIDLDCNQCEIDKETLQKKDGDSYKMPESCSVCYQESSKISEGETVIPMISHYFLPAFRACASTAIFEKTSLVSKSNLDICSSDCEKLCFIFNEECNKNIENAKNCENDDANSQCKFGLDQLGSLIYYSELVPYSYIICRESCSPQKGSDSYTQLSECKTSCLEKKIETKSFTLEGYQQCKTENVLICPKWDEDCKTAVKNYQSEFDKLEILDCKICEDEKKTLQSQKLKNEILFPVSCQRCHTEILKSNEATPKKVSQFYVDVLKDCASFGELKKESKFNKLQFKNCFANCDKCLSDKDCKAEQQKQQECVQDQDNEQCKHALSQFEQLKDTENLIYPYVVCQESCRLPKTENKQYEKIQVCQDKCLIGEDSDVDIDQETFSYQAYLTCKEENVLICPEWDKNCIASVEDYESNLKSDTLEECMYCNQQIEKLSEKDKTLEFGFPSSCLQCHTKVLHSKHDTPKKVQEFYLQIYKNCALSGTRDRESNTLKSSFNDCKQKCDSCSTDANCINQQRQVKKCVEDDKNPQCKFGQNAFTLTKDDEKLPYPFVVCQESCRIEYGVSERFGQIQTCLDKCYIGEESDVDIDTQTFKYEGYLQCKNENVLKCPLFNQECIQSVERFEENLKNKEIQICALCEQEKHILSKNQKTDDKNGFFFPLSCTLCHNEVLISKKGEDPEIITDFYLPAFRECAQSASFDIKSKTYTVKYQSCVDKCDECRGDQPCDRDEENHSQCKGDENNFQCNYGRRLFNEATETDPLPYPYIICQQSCQIPNPSEKFKGIQQCRDNCMLKQDSDLIIETQDFTYGQFLECKKQNVMNCDSRDIQCVEQLEKYEQKLNDNLQEDCEQCKIEKRILRKQSKDTDDFKFPVQCSKCYQKQLIKIDDSPTSKYLANFFLNNYRDCALFGKIERTDIIKTNKKDFETCSSQCDQCGSVTDCQNFQKRHQDCFKDSKNEQCVYGLDQFSSAKAEEPLPYSYVVCKESCRQYEQNVNAKYQKIQQCFDKCYLGEETEPIIDVNEDFTYENFLTCRKNNVFSCPTSNDPCNDAVDMLSDRINKPTLEACVQCKKDRDYLSTKQEKGKDDQYFMPITCIECYKEALIIHKDDTAPYEVKEFYIPPLRDCAIFGEIIYKTKTKKVNFKSCSSLCDNCKGDKSCESSQKEHKACVDNKDNEQCQYGLSAYQAADEQDLLPVPYINCKESCRILVKEDSKYQRIQKCFDNCYKDINPPDVKTGDFKYKQFLECKQKQVLECPIDNQPCNDVVTRYTEKINDVTILECQQCKQERDYLSEDLKDDDKDNYYIPKSCQLCYIDNIVPDKDDKEVTQDMKDYFFAQYRQCAEFGKVKETQKQYNKEYYDSCLNHCNICPAEEKDCQSNQEQFEKCYSQSDLSQCKLAYSEYQKNINPTDKVPVSYIICRESCKNPKPEPLFWKDIQLCYDDCNNDILTMHFKYDDFLVCKQSYVLNCPSYNKDCQNSQQYYENKIKKSQSNNCKKCANELKLEISREEEDALKKNQFPFPKSCSQCYVEQLDDKTDAKPEYAEFSKYYVSNFKSCAEEGKVDLDAVGVKTTLEQFEICKTKCSTCDTDDCKQNQKKYDECQFTQDYGIQCEIGARDFQNADTDQILPYTYVVCQQSCKIPSPDQLFGKRQKCLSSCILHSSYTLDFTFQELNNCLSQYVADTQPNSLAYEHKQFLEICLAQKNKEGQKIESCGQCLQIHQSELDDDDFVPYPCQQCLTDCIKSQEQSQNHIYNKYVLEPYEQCYQDPQNMPRIIETNNNITYTEQCLKSCDSVQNYKCDNPSCTTFLSDFNKCTANHDKDSQCNLAFSKLEILKEKQKLFFNYPFEIEICREGCIPEQDSPNEQFNNIVKCQSDCSRKSVKDLSQQEYTYGQVDYCLDLNNPYLQDDSSSIKYQLSITQCSESNEFEVCQWCQELSPQKTDSTKYQSTLFYTACKDCWIKCASKYTPEHKNALQLFIQSVLVACHSQGEFPENEAQLVFSRNATIKQANECVQKNCQCEGVCQNYQNKYQQSIDKSPQCNLQKQKFDGIDENKYQVPFPKIVCNYAANDTLDYGSDAITFLQYFQCESYCNKFGVPPTVITRKNFTIFAHAQCTNAYCPRFNSQSNKEASNIQREINDCYYQKVDECILCIEYTTSDDTDFYPEVCQQCRSKCLEIAYKLHGKNQQFVELAEPCYKQCDENGTYLEPKFLEASIDSEQFCKIDKHAEHCNDTSPDYKDCKMDKRQYDECIAASSQCQLAINEYKGFVEKEEYVRTFPYKLFLCRQSCKPSNFYSRQFAEMLKIQEECETKYYIHKHEYHEFTTSEVRKCISHFVATCPPWDNYCTYEYSKFNTCYGIKTETGIRPSCDKCEALLKSNRTAEDKYKHPVACQECVQECMKLSSSSKSEVFRSLINKQMIECHRSTKPLDIHQSTTTKFSYKKCREELCINKLNCKYAKNNKECLKDFKLYTDCEQQEGQCFLSSDIYEKTENLTFLDPSKLICTESCLPNDPGFDFKLIYECDQFCQNGEYVPKPRPNPEPTPEPKPDEKKDNKFGFNTGFQALVTLILTLMVLI